MNAELLVDSKCILAEGIQWREDQQRLWWSDIHGRALWSCDEDGQRVQRRDTPERLSAFAFDPVGHMLCAFESGLFRWDLEGDRLDRLTEFEPTQRTTRMNDGRCDRQGRFVVGGVDEDGLKPTSSVVRYADGMMMTIMTSVGCANSICFSPDGRWMYFADTPTNVIRRFEYEPATGTPGEMHEFFVDPALTGFPDGACVDAAGAIWSARFNGGEVGRVLPDGSPDTRIVVGVPQVTCACFGGRHMDRMFITTARENMSEAEIAANPLSGGIFTVRPGVTGLPENRFAQRLFPS